MKNIKYVYLIGLVLLTLSSCNTRDVDSTLETNIGITRSFTGVFDGTSTTQYSGLLSRQAYYAEVTFNSGTNPSGSDYIPIATKYTLQLSSFQTDDLKNQFKNITFNSGSLEITAGSLTWDAIDIIEVHMVLVPKSGSDERYNIFSNSGKTGTEAIPITITDETIKKLFDESYKEVHFYLLSDGGTTAPTLTEDFTIKLNLDITTDVETSGLSL